MTRERAPSLRLSRFLRKWYRNGRIVQPRLRFATYNIMAMLYMEIRSVWRAWVIVAAVLHGCWPTSA
jgi:hypothetical protein